MRSVNIIEYSIKNQVETNISQKYSSDYHTIFSVFLNIVKIDVFHVTQNKTKEILNKKRTF